MKKVIKLSMVALVASLVVGCATNSDFDKLQSQIDGLKITVDQESSNAQTALSAANAANNTALTANTTANRALEVANETNTKLDNVFKKAMVK